MEIGSVEDEFKMEKRFEVEFLPTAAKFMNGLDGKAQKKIYFNIRKAQVMNDPELFKKLTGNIWEFRTLYNQTYYRLFAFWDKRAGKISVVIATHGLIKKTGKTPKTDLAKAETIRTHYLKQTKPNYMSSKKLKTVSLETMIDTHIGKEGTPNRDIFEQELKIELLGLLIKEARLHQNLTQEELGKLVGVQKAQISKLENNFTNARIDTVLKVFKALKAKVRVRVELPKRKPAIAEV